MGKTIFAENSALTYLKDLSKSTVCSTGLILGQSTATKDYVVHLVRTLEQTDSEIQLVGASPANFKCIQEINENWIADHAKHVTKMLPGGMWVLGVFVCSPGNFFSDSTSESKARSILSALKKQVSSEPLIYGNGTSVEKILLHFNTEDFKHTCKSYDFNIVTNTFKSVDWKFQNNYTKWCKIYCNFGLNLPSFGGNMSCPVKQQLKLALKEVNTSLEEAMVVLNGRVKGTQDLLESLMRTGKVMASPDKLPSLKANIFMRCKKDDSNVKIIINNCDVELHLLGVVSCQVYLSEKTTIGEAIAALKQDIMRSLAARFEMHWDSLVEEEYGSPEEKLSVHEPPRRVSVTLPGTLIALNDYLFPGEGVSEVVTSFKEMLDVDISEANMEKEIEVQGDSMEFYGKSSMNFSSTSSNELLGSSIPKGLILFLCSFIVILLAILIGLFVKK